ncbi:RAB24, member RAS oncogene family [Nesidiocoris tenuis]|uniref:RAB24, member RAS oncogene family n=1 Tax=Nesidiocoris tenuis TaxID=355587 RepID=A0ABN7BCT0_9HEMI|nr:RAB24, member RAS oncogene family [Nesidiocoris tenuis]
MARDSSSKKRVDAKIVIVGSSGAGKTALMERFVYSKFTQVRVQTIGATYVSKEVFRGKESIHLSIWDTAGTERYRSMMKQYYRNAKGAIICYDITDKHSWDALRSWATEIRGNEPDCRLFICGTKKDIVDEGYAPPGVHSDCVKFYAEGLQAPSIVSSSKTGENVDALFSMVADELWEEVHQKPLKKDVVSLDKPVRRNCCYSA